MAEPYICPHCHTKWLSIPDACQCGMVNKPGPEPPVNGVMAALFPAEAPPTPLEQRAPQPPNWQDLLYAQHKETTALAQQLDATKAEHAQLMQAFSTMLQPLAAWWQQRGHTVAVQDLIPRTVEAITALAQQAQPPRQTASAPATPETGLLVQALEALRLSIDALHAKFSAPPEPYPTWLQTDARIAQMERGIRESNTLRQEGFPGLP